MKPSEALASTRAAIRHVVESYRARNAQVAATRFYLAQSHRWINYLWHIKSYIALMLMAGALITNAQPIVQLPDDGSGMGLTQILQPDGGQVTVFYPAAGREAPIQKGPFQLSVIMNGAPIQGNAHLIVISHGSGGSPWVHANLARTLVQRGFTVALPQHHADNYLDTSHPGPQSWRLRPREVSETIDIVQQNQLLASHLGFESIGVFGGSAGGHTVLSLAGGRWSDARFRAHCDQYIEDDFSSCVGFTTLLHGDWLDGLKLWFARHVIDWRFSDETLREDRDSRIRAAVAMVPFAADFLPDSLKNPKIPLGLVVAEKDINQIPRFHVKAVLDACVPNCEVVMDLPEAGHGAMLSPVPPLNPGSVAAHLLADPPDFDREHAIPELNSRIADFFERHLIPRESGSAMLEKPGHAQAVGF